MTRVISRLLLAVLLLSTEFASTQRAPIPQQLTFTPYHSTGIYKIGETVGWTVTPGPVTPTYAYKYTVRRNNNVVLKEGKLDLSSGKDTIAIEQLFEVYPSRPLMRTSPPSAATIMSSSRKASSTSPRARTRSRSLATS